MATYVLAPNGKVIKNSGNDTVEYSESAKDNKNKIKTYIVEPSLTFIFDRLYPYIVLTCVIFFLLIMLCIIILFIFIRNHQNLIKFSS